MSHLNELAKTYGSKGLVVIALSKEAKGTIEPWLEANGVEYPVFVDDGGGTASAYGVSGIPSSALIGPDGKVAWQGHPSGLNAQVIEPVLAKVMLRFGYDFPGTFKAAQAKIQKKDYAGATAELEKLADLSGPDADFATKLRADLTGYAEDKNAQVKADAEAGNYASAMETLTELSAQYKGHAVGDAAAAQLKEWKGDKKVQGELKASQLFAAAKDAERAMEFGKAATIYATLAKKHADCKVAPKAEEALTRIEKEKLLKFDPGCNNCKKARKTCDKHRQK